MGQLLKFKAGAFLAGAPILPICFKFDYTNFNPAWIATGHGNILFLFYRACCQFVNRLEIAVLPVYFPNEEEKKDPNLYAENVRRYMAVAMDMPISNTGLEMIK